MFGRGQRVVSGLGSRRQIRTAVPAAMPLAVASVLCVWAGLGMAWACWWGWALMGQGTMLVGLEKKEMGQGTLRDTRWLSAIISPRSCNLIQSSIEAIATI